MGMTDGNPPWLDCPDCLDATSVNEAGDRCVEHLGMRWPPRTLSDFRPLLGEDPDPEVSPPTRVLSEAYDEIVRLRAEVERCEKRWAELRAWLGPESWTHDDCEVGSCDGCMADSVARRMDALARGDGAPDE